MNFYYFGSKWSVGIAHPTFLESVLPSELGFNFLSNISKNVRDIIKNTLSPVIIIPTPGVETQSQDDSAGEGDNLTASLLAQESAQQISLLPSHSVGNDSTIWQSSIKQCQSIQQSRIEVDRSREINSNEIPRPSSVSQVSTTEVTANKLGIAQTGFGQVGISQVGSIQVGSSQIGSSQIGIVQISSTEISLPSSITLQQLLSSHNPNLQNTTVSTWTSFLQSPTPFNLKLEVSDLPTGQLAEATITGYDTFNRPNSGTLTLDINGNGSGWFIDTTPEDNSEFTTQLADTAYKATADSAEYDDKYLY